MLGIGQRQNWVDSGLPYWQLLLVPEVLVVLVRLAVLPVGVAGPAAASLGVLAAGLAVAAGPLRPVVAAGLGWPVVVVAAGVAADLLSLLPAWPLLRVLALP